MRRLRLILAVLLTIIGSLVLLGSGLFIGMSVCADDDIYRVPPVPCDRVEPVQHEGRFVRLRGPLVMDAARPFIGQLGAYRVSFVNELTCDHNSHPPYPTQDAMVVGTHEGDYVHVWYNYTDSPLQWHLCCRIFRYGASDFLSLPDFLLICLLLLGFSFLIFLAAFGLYPKNLRTKNNIVNN